MPTTYRGSFTILNGADTTRHGFGDLTLDGVIKTTGRTGVPHEIKNIGTGSIILQTESGDINLNTGAGGNVNINSETDFAVNGTNYTFKGEAVSGDVTIESIGGATRNIMIETNGSNAGTGVGNITIQNTNAANKEKILIFNASTDTNSTGIAINTGGSNIEIGGTPSSGNVILSRDGKLTDVKGNMTVAGNLTVQGTSTTVISETLNIQDNIFVINSNAGTVVDTGILAKRFQEDNITGQGAIVNSASIATTGTAQTNASTTSIILDSNASTVDDFYNGTWIRIISGTGAGYVRQITDYVGSTKTCTLSTALPALLSTDSVYNIYSDKLYTGLIYNESQSTWSFASTSSDPAADTGVTDSDLVYADLKVRNITVTGEINGNITGFVTTTTSINETVSTEVPIPGFTKFRGTGTIIVTGQTAGSACATFMVSKSLNGEEGQIQRITSSSSSLGAGPGRAELDIVWPSALNSVPRIFHSTVSPTSNAITYNIAYLVL